MTIWFAFISSNSQFSLNYNFTKLNFNINNTIKRKEKRRREEKKRKNFKINQQKNYVVEVMVG